MKKFSILASFLLGFVSASLQAGEAVAYKQVAPIPPPLYGTGFYGAIDMGANVYQDRGGDRIFTNEFGDTLEISPKTTSVFSAASRRVTFLAPAYFVRPLKETSFTTAFAAALTAL
jgi:hypothetical protein